MSKISRIGLIQLCTAVGMFINISPSVVTGLVDVIFPKVLDYSPGHLNADEFI